MTVRTFKQCGLGFGAEPLSIVAKIDGVVVFEGEIPTVDMPLPSPPDQIPDSVNFSDAIFSWPGTVEFSGTSAMELTVEGTGTLFLTDTLANFVKVGNIPPSESAYDSFYSYSTGNVIVTDPFTDPKIDGAEVVRDRDFDPANPLDGQWWYIIDSGSVFTGTLNITAGNVPPPAETPPETP